MSFKILKIKLKYFAITKIEIMSNYTIVHITSEKAVQLFSSHRQHRP